MKAKRATVATEAFSVTLGQVLDLDQALGRVMLRDVAYDTANALADIVTVVMEKLKFYEQRHNALVQELGADRAATDAEITKGAPAIVRTVTPENRQVFDQRIAELRAVSIKFHCRPIQKAELAKIEIRTADLMVLKPLVRN